MLTKQQTIAYVGLHAKDYGLDPAALLAVANGEGLKTDPGSVWYLKGEAGGNFGPPSWYSGATAAGADFMKHFGVSTLEQASQIAWSPVGLDYWMQQAAASGAKNLTGTAAISALIEGFERPAVENRAGNKYNAGLVYQSFQQQIASLLSGGIDIPSGGSNGSDNTDTSGQGNPIVPVPPSAIDKPGSGGSSGQAPNAPAGSQDIKIASIGAFSLGPFSTNGLQIGVPSGFVLGMLGFGLLALGALLFIAGSKGPMRFSDSGEKVKIVSAATAKNLP